MDPFPGTCTQLRMILIYKFIFKTSAHLTNGNVSPMPLIGRSKPLQQLPVG